MYSMAGWLGRGQRNRAETSQSRDFTSPNHTETVYLSSHSFYFHQIRVFVNKQGSILNLNLLIYKHIIENEFISVHNNTSSLLN